MTSNLEIYKCDICNNIVEVLHGEGVPLVCCGQKMELLKEQTADTSKEKHVPFIEKIEGGYKVRIGENESHPMTKKHYIQWIELIAGNRIYRKELAPDDIPEVVFKIEKLDNVYAREYCNIHGLWKGRI
ncbi:desulfoferrodoxin [Abyssisolibacter fermentans]|uniref:desulfoferrodoxin n=1 Tax=Abyssisolibacter fermentans TaxID=1766203 RepID=UPI00082EC4BC|nr:desulfoferrodoxin [Abyssisolibacter fermentans]